MFSKASFILTLVIFVLFFQEIAFTQPQTDVTKARNVSTFKYVSSEDLMAYLDDFAVRLQNDSDAIGHIITYRNVGELQGKNLQLFVRAKYYLVEQRGIQAQRLIYINGSIRSENSYECWITPNNAEPPKPSPTITEPIIDEKQTYKFDSHLYPSPNDCGYAINCLEDKYHLAQLDEYAKILKKRSDVKAHLVIYSGYEWPMNDSKKKSLSALSKETEYLTKTHGIVPSRIFITYGGRRRVRSVDLWVIQQNADLPELTPDKVPRKKSKR